MGGIREFRKQVELQNPRIDCGVIVVEFEHPVYLVLLVEG
jgi:hypothetical protein